MIGAAMRKFSGAGRKPRQGVQRSNRRIVYRDRGEREEDVLRTAVQARMRHFGVKRDDARDQLLGSALGRLAHAKLITARQYSAGVRFARVQALQNLLDDVRPGYGVPVLASLSCGSGRDPYDGLDPDLAWDATDMRNRLDIIAKIRRDHQLLTDAVWELEGRPETAGAGSVLNAVIMWDRSVAASSDRALGVLRCGLNSFVRLWGIEE